MGKTWLNTSDVADELDVCAMTVTRLIASGKLPAYKFGHNFRIDAEDLELFIRNSRVHPQDADPEACDQQPRAS